MKISELAEASGESIATIKFYIRENLLPPGETVAKTQAHYGEVHRKRLDLIRTLQTELGMSIDRIREVLAEAEQGGVAMLAAGLKNARESRHGDKKLDQSSPEMGRAWELLTRLEKDLGWDISPEHSSAADVAEAVATILRVMPDAKVEDSLVEYAKVMKSVADQEIPESFDPAGDPWDSLRYAVLGTYLFEPLILGLRRMAHGQRTAEIMKARGEPAAAKES